MTDATPSILRLDDAPGTTEPEPFAGPDHPIRKVVRQVAFDGAWDATRAAKIAALFDSVAADWAEERVNPTKSAPILDAVERGEVSTSGRWLELGSGTGAGTRALHDRVDSLLAFDLSGEMLAHAPGELAPRLRGDASSLPFAADSFDVVLMVNMLLFPHEVDRVLAADGTVVWVNSLGDQTPIHLSPEDVAAALPGEWRGLTARAGSGFWATLTRF